MSSAQELFEHVAEWHVIVCKQCRCAVWPTEVAGHLRGRQHRQPMEVAKAIADQVEGWAGVVQFPSEFQTPASMPQRIPQFPLYDDGLQCQLEPDRCRYIARDVKPMKEHWRQQHGWSVARDRGGSGFAKQEATETRFKEGARPVQCQRFFQSRAHSQYFEVEGGREQPEAPNRAQNVADIWESAWQQASQRYDERQNASTIQPGEADEVNPWLRRTGWIEYLKGCQLKELLQSTRRPVDERATESEREPVAAAIWEAVGDVAAISQDTVKDSGVMLRFEAVRTEKDKVQYQPLETYRDHDSVRKQCRPWQQMVVFFVRTQQDHEWTSPPYRFNRRQQRAFDRMVDCAQQDVEGSSSGEGSDSSSDGGDDGEDDVGDHSSDRSTSGRHTRLTDLQAACLAFCVELLNQTMYSRETDMALVCALAVIGVSPKGIGFQSTKSFPSTLSAIIKVAHFMVVQQAYVVAQRQPEKGWEGDSSPCDFEDSGYESEAVRRRRKPRSSFEWVKKMLGEFMVRGSGSPMQWMLDLRAYGMKVDFNTTSDGHVAWKDDDVLTYKNIHFSMADFRGMAHQLQASTRETLRGIMFAGSDDEIPAVPWSQLFDDPSNASVGWSFVDDTRTAWPVEGKEWLFQRIQRRPEQRRRFASESSANGINQGKVRDWLREVDGFRGQLLALMHITGGQPARGPEILSVRHSNTIQGGHRNLFIEDGMVVFVTHYHKGEQYHGDVKIIHRYLPREVGELIVWYVWLVLPFVQRIKGWLWPQSPVSQHIWGPDVEGRRWTTERLKGHLQRATEAGLGHSIHVAAYRHIAIAISRRWVRASSAFQDEVGIRDDDEASDEQATHSPFTAGAVYAREVDELPGSTASRRQQFRVASVDWHRFLGFTSSVKSAVESGLKRKADPFQRHSKRARVERQEQLRQMDAQAELSWMMERDVALRSVQGEAFQAIQRGDGKIVVVMPTGAGKSVLFMLPAFISAGGVSIVVVPFIPLRHDVVTRCNKASVRVAEWNGKRSVDGASIVLVTPEATAQDGFQTFLRRMRQTEQLDRIVIDECHVLLGEQGGFWPDLQKLSQLVSAHTQMLLLTATLPPTEEAQLIQRMFWEQDEVTVVRASTVRRNIEYSVVDGTEGFEAQVQQLADIVQPTVQAGEKAVILCDDIKRIEAIVEARAFPCEAFHARMSSQARGELLSAYRAGEVPVFVATSTFGTGIDISDIRLFVHITMPDNMREYAQSSGRAGRDGQVSRAIIIRGGRVPHDKRVQAYISKRQCRRVVLDEYLDGDSTRSECRAGEAACDWCQQQRSGTFQAPAAVMTAGASRSITTPVQRQGVQEETGQSARSEGRRQMNTSSAVVSSSPLRRLERADRERAQPDSRRREQRRMQQGWHEEMQRRLQQWKNRCVVYYSQGRDSTHPVSRCPEELGKKVERERQIVQRSIRYPSGQVCYRCGIPRAICEGWSSDGRVREVGEGAGQRGCQFYGVLLGVVYAAKHGYPEVWQGWFQVARRDASWTGQMATFLGVAIKQDEGWGCQIGRAFMWITEEIEEVEKGERVR